MPSLTIVTSVLNGQPFVGAMLASVPRHREIEHLAIDAGSTDGTVELLRRSPGVRLIERPGLPLYAAWNEALEAAGGAYVMFLNADDELASGAVDAVLSGLDAAGDADMLCGEAEAFIEPAGPDGAAGAPVRRYRGEALAGLGPEVLIFGPCIINAKVFRRETLVRNGGFDQSFAFAADRELLLRLALTRPQLRLRALPGLIYRYRIHPGSMTLQQRPGRRLEIAAEHRRIAQRLLAASGLDAKTRGLLRAWAAHEAAVQVVNGLRTSAFRKAASGLQVLLSPPWQGTRDLALAVRARRALESARRGVHPSQEVGL